MGSESETPSVANLYEPFYMEVSSTCCAQVAYEPLSETLTIEFQQRGTYQYTGFPEDAYQDFAAAGSKGQYFNENIRGQYAYERIE